MTSASSNLDSAPAGPPVSTLAYQNRHYEISMPQKMIAACSGSLLTSVVVTPFDVVRVRLQQQSAFPIATATSLATKRHGSTIPVGVGVTSCCRNVFWFPSTIDYCVASELDCCAAEEAKKKRFTGTFEGLRKIGQYEGVSGLWRGLGLTLIMSIPSNVVYFIGYEHLRDNMPFQSQILTPLISGSLARTISATVVSPLELIKTRLQSVSSTSRHKALNDVIKGMRDMVKSQGILSLWRGLVLTLWRDVPFSGIYWMSVEAIKSRLSKAEYFQYHPEHRFLETLIAGSVGGTIASILTAPFDVGKTRRQVGHHSSTSNNMGMFKLLASIAKNEGFGALYVGALPRILKVAPACAIMITSYETGKKVFSRLNGTDN